MYCNLCKCQVTGIQCLDPEISRKLVSGFLNSGSPRFARASTAAAAAAAGGGGCPGIMFILCINVYLWSAYLK